MMAFSIFPKKIINFSNLILVILSKWKNLTNKQNKRENVFQIQNSNLI
jgi:hypothetical protein